MSLLFRRAARADLNAIVTLLADDMLGSGRERPGDPGYAVAFEAIDADPNQLLLVAELDGVVVGCQQITFIPGLTRKGIWRGLIEAVRVRADLRSRGIGAKFIEHAVAECRRRGCKLVQLTSHNTRRDAHRFYIRLGFHASHTGFKLEL